MFLGVLRFAKNMKFLLKGRIRRIFGIVPGHFFCMGGSSVTELTEDDNATLAVTVQIQMSPKGYCFLYIRYVLSVVVCTVITYL